MLRRARRRTRVGYSTFEQVNDNEKRYEGERLQMTPANTAFWVAYANTQIQKNKRLPSARERRAESDRASRTIRYLTSKNKIKVIRDNKKIRVTLQRGMYRRDNRYEVWKKGFFYGDNKIVKTKTDAMRLAKKWSR
jgi:hypothetical protein